MRVLEGRGLHRRAKFCAGRPLMRMRCAGTMCMWTCKLFIIHKLGSSK